MMLIVGLTVATIIGAIFLTLTFVNNSSLDYSSLPKKTSFSITEYKIPDLTSSPLFPVYDNMRHVIWVGDTRNNSSRIWEFDIIKHEFVEHKLDSVRYVTVVTLDSDGNLWYIDPASRFLGHYNPNNQTNKIIKIPSNGTLTSIVLDSAGNVWISGTSSDVFLKYYVHNATFLEIPTPTPHASPLGMVKDKSGKIWVAEAIGALASVDPTLNKITEYRPHDIKLKIPVATQLDPNDEVVYITEHGEDALFSFDTKSENFVRHALHHDPQALPYGMAFDKHGNLWIAEHTVNKVAVFVPSTGYSTEIQIPSPNPLTQWFVADEEGRIWFAEPGGAAIGVINETN